MYWLRVFGGLGIEHEGAVVDDVVSHRKALALLAVLAAQGPTSRDRLLALLWPESDTARARGSLKQVVHFLRRRLNAPDLFLGIDELRLNPAIIETDVGKFADACATGDLRGAAALYGGRFLDGFHAGNASEFDRWAAARSDEFSQQYVRVLEQLARAAEAKSDFAEAALWWCRVQAVEPTNSRFTLLLMQALDAAGQRAAALQHARTQELLLREEWGLEPDAAVTAFAHELRALLPVVAPDEPARDALQKSAASAAIAEEAPAGPLRPRPRALAGVIILLAAATLVTVSLSARLLKRSVPGDTAAPRRIVVLPFEESGDSEEIHYLTVGLSDALSNELARFRSAIAPTYNSTIGYKGTSKSLAQIAQETSAAAIISGSVTRAGGRVRVEVRLFDAKSNRQLWSQRYEQPTSSALDIQRSLMRGIVAALRLDVSAAERALSSSLPTTNARAYDLYLRGRALELAQPSIVAPTHAEKIRDAQSLYSQARDLDPKFAMARSRLSLMHTYSAMLFDPTSARSEQARLEAEAALRIRPGLAEAHEALAAYWDVGRKDYARSVAQLKLTLAGWPNSADQHLNLAAIYRKQGHLDESVAALEQAQRLEPHSYSPAQQLAFMYTRLRRYKDAVEAWDRVIAQAPDIAAYQVARGYVFLRWLGTADTLAAALRRIPSDWDINGMGTYARYVAARVGRRHRAALTVLNASRYEASFDTYIYRPLSLLRAQSYEALGEHARARSNYEAARVLLMDSIAAHPDEIHLDYATSTPAARMRIALGLAYAGLGRKQEAVREARRAMKLVPLSGNLPPAMAIMADAVEIFARAGERNAGFELIELLLGMPAGRELSVALLRVDPVYDPLRNDPRFEQVLARFTAN